MVRNQTSIQIGSEVQCFFERKDHNSNVYKDRARIPMFGRIRSEFQCLKKLSRIPVFGRITSQLQCLQG